MMLLDFKRILSISSADSSSYLQMHRRLSNFQSSIKKQIAFQNSNAICACKEYCPWHCTSGVEWTLSVCPQMPANPFRAQPSPTHTPVSFLFRELHLPLSLEGYLWAAEVLLKVPGSSNPQPRTDGQGVGNSISEAGLSEFPCKARLKLSLVGHCLYCTMCV